MEPGTASIYKLCYSSNIQNLFELLRKQNDGDVIGQDVEAWITIGQYNWLSGDNFCYNGWVIGYEYTTTANTATTATATATHTCSCMRRLSICDD